MFCSTTGEQINCIAHNAVQIGISYNEHGAFAEIVTITVTLNRYIGQRGFQISSVSVLGIRGIRCVSSYGFCTNGEVRVFLSQKAISRKDGPIAN